MNSDITLEEAKEIVKTTGKKLIWVGAEMHFETAKSALQAGESDMEYLNIRQLQNMDDMKGLEGNVFVCYHGNTSGAVVNYLDRLNIKSYNLRGGVTAIVGEIF